MESAPQRHSALNTITVTVLPQTRRSDEMQAALVLSKVGAAIFKGQREGEVIDGGEVVGRFEVAAEVEPPATPGWMAPGWTKPS